MYLFSFNYDKINLTAVNDFKVHTSIGSWGNGLLTENLNQKVGNKMFLTHIIINCSDLHFIITI